MNWGSVRGCWQYIRMCSFWTGVGLLRILESSVKFNVCCQVSSFIDGLTLSVEV